MKQFLTCVWLALGLVSSNGSWYYEVLYTFGSKDACESAVEMLKDRVELRKGLLVIKCADSRKYTLVAWEDKQ